MSLHISLALVYVKLTKPGSVTSSFGFSKLNPIDTGNLNSADTKGKKEHALHKRQVHVLNQTNEQTH